MGGATLPKNKMNNNQTKKPSTRAIKSGINKMKNFNEAVEELKTLRNEYCCFEILFLDGSIWACFDALTNEIRSACVVQNGIYNLELSRKAFEMLK